MSLVQQFTLSRRGGGQIGDQESRDIETVSQNCVEDDNLAHYTKVTNEYVHLIIVIELCIVMFGAVRHMTIAN